MGRSRGNFQSDEDPTQRSRRKKNSSSGDNLESTTAGQGTTEGKKALYHCNYCIKDITGKIRIKCAMCPDFDLCIECFSVGAELTPHKSNHPYRVMDNLSFPLICPDWNADDEMLLLEGIEMYGFWNWTEVAEHVGTKSKEQCIEHYSSVYMNSPYFPLPDMSHVVGKNRKELLAMAKGHGEDKKGYSILGELTLKEESPFSPPRVKVEDTHKVDPSGRLSSSATSEGSFNVATTTGNKKASSANQVKDGLVKMEDSQTDRNFKGKKPNLPANKGPSLIELSGYNEKRQEFDPEYDNEAEQLLAEMEFKDADGEDERELKMRVLRIYSKRLDERKRRKDFILQRNLLYPSSFEKDLSVEEMAICRQYDVFMRFHSKEEHKELLKTVVAEHRTLKRIQELKEARAAGCRTPTEVEIFLDKKRKRECDLTGPGSQGNSIMLMPSESGGKDSNSRAAVQGVSGSLNDLDTLGFNGADFLSEAEKRVCSEIRVSPPVYLRMEEVLSVEIFNGNVSNKTDAHRLFKIEATKVDRIYEMLIKKGIAQP
ncbi:transcriptional adapter ADA2b-like [Cucurbita pepo subsp. pepo]|uniref:transcriptional adapter ADA2b-like n=1 Tax=Cucurbita pepo subsp. pepo TaxID=3664 RepID=UPI000C9D6C42|nr:transcriptional adapter ADA2b-like [Cucurbita pepo subsp. pepo]